MLGYCDFNQPYLNQITVANEVTAGVNPLNLDKIKSDLNKLPVGTQAILYFHWGMEHVWLPPTKNILLAKRLLDNSRVLTIIGMHPHRFQGILTHNGKKAYMSLGNFSFPNFYIEPPTQISYPNEEKKKDVKYQTRQYHYVHKLTYKKWRLVNRVSMILNLKTDGVEMDYEFVKQDDDTPVIQKLNFLEKVIFKTLLNVLNLLMKLPISIYDIIWKIHAFQVSFMWRLQIRIFQFKQLGAKTFFTKGLNYVRKKL